MSDSVGRTERQAAPRLAPLLEPLSGRSGVPVRAVVFDLWLTLIPFPDEVRRSAFARTAEVLGVGAGELRPHWDATRLDRETTDLRTYLAGLGQRLGLDWSAEAIEAAVTSRSSSHGACFAQPFADGRDAIAGLRDRGVSIGLVSNCTSEVRQALREHAMDRWFDQIVLSAEVGVMKPDPAIYELAARRLEVEPGCCLYVGDGSDNELDGAAEAGMTPVLYDRASTGSAKAAVTISSHLELLRLVDR